MPKLDRYLLREFVQSFLATLTVLLVVSLGGVLVDILGNIADGRLPASLMLSQLGLQAIVYLPIVVPLSLMLGLLLAIARLYRDSEMAVFHAVGVGPARLLRPLLYLIIPVVAIVGMCSLWLGPWADRTGEIMIEQASRSLVMSGLEPGRFTRLPGGGVVYINSANPAGDQLTQIFMQRQRDERVDIVSAKRGELFFEGENQRYLRLHDGYQVEAPVDPNTLNYRLLKFEVNEAALPSNTNKRDPNTPELLTTQQLIGDPRPAAVAQLHSRITPPLLAFAFALMTLPLARSTPRQARYGRIIVGFLGYLIATNIMFIGTRALADGKIPSYLGLWWLSLPLLLLAVFLYSRDGQIGIKRRKL